jgi:hypothetical protein
MKIVSFELTMPNKGSWNGKWSGEDKKYFVIRKYSDKYFKSNENFKVLLENGSDGWHYSWGDGWGANVHAQIVSSAEATKRRKISRGFCGYEWMIDSIVRYGEIFASHEIPKETNINQ